MCKEHNHEICKSQEVHHHHKHEHIAHGVGCICCSSTIEPAWLASHIDKQVMDLYNLEIDDDDEDDEDTPSYKKERKLYAIKRGQK